jgi:hypothetical protein
MIRTLLLIGGALALAGYLRALHAQATYDDAINRMLALVPDDQRADFRSLAERERDPHPRSWRR